jgi:hypothetical protein
MPVIHAYNTRYSEDRDQGICLRSAPGQIVCKTLWRRGNPSQKRTGGVAQAVTALPSKHEVVSSNYSAIKKKRFFLVSFVADSDPGTQVHTCVSIVFSMWFPKSPYLPTSNGKGKRG